ncbi:TetR family transcriptional regulator [Endozoicomonas sp.]|uniref:TetR family transcriptional regulator n=1 Tax=Endozoicomonas sp. TaxID=1892382 RepID=UPI00383A1DE2
MVRRTKEDAEKTRLQLLEAALALFSDKGIANVTLAQIASASGVTRGAIYWHFKDKSQMLEALWERVFDPLDQHFAAQLEADDEDPLEVLCNLGKRVLQEVATNLQFQQVCRISQQAAFDLQMIERWNQFCQRSQKEVTVLMQRARDRGLLREGITPEAASLVASGCFHGVIERWLSVGGVVDLEREGDAIAEAIFAGLRR